MLLKLKRIFVSINPDVLDYKQVFVLYTLFFLILCWPYIFQNKVISPYQPDVEIGDKNITNSSSSITSRKHSDYFNVYIPEIYKHISGKRSGWIKLWTNDNESGRPVFHISGFSPAYFPTWLIFHIIQDPQKYITFLSLSFCFISGVLGILYFREINLSPLAGLIAGTGLATSPLFMYWLTFPMFPAVWCWATGALLGLIRIANKSDLLGWSILAFSVYSLLMTAYPQPVVYHIYILGGYSLYLASCIFRDKGSFAVRRYLLFVFSAALTGAIFTVPVYFDLANTLADSSRIAPDPSFFTAVLANYSSLSFSDWWRVFVLSTLPELLGNPASSLYPLPYDGLSITLPVIFFSTLGIIHRFKKVWGWWLVILLLVLFAFSHSLYEFGVKYLGFNLSRSNPMGSIILPLTIISAYGMDLVVKRTGHERVRLSIVFNILVVLLVLSAGIGFGIRKGISIHWDVVLISIGIIALLAIQYKRTHPIVLLVAIILTIGLVSRPLMFSHQPIENKITPLIEKVQHNLPDGSKFAIFDQGLSVLPPNFNAYYNLPSIHSYNSLSSKYYHHLVKELGGDIRNYGRWNGYISPDFDGMTFWMGNISLILASSKLIHNNLQLLGEEAGVYLYKVVSRMGESIQILTRDITEDSEDVEVNDPRQMVYSIPKKTKDLDDLLEFEVDKGAASLLVLSQKFHKDWQAEVFVDSKWKPAKTVVVNDIFQGVILPKNTSIARLKFKPFSRHAWVGHVFWTILLLLMVFKFCSMAWKPASTEGKP